MADRTADIQDQNLSELVASQQATIAELRGIVASQQAANAELKATIAELRGIVASQQATIATLKRMVFGRKSERVVASGDAQPMLPGMEEAMAASPMPADAPAGTTPVSAHSRAKRQGQPEAGWNGFPADLPREEVVIDLPEERRGGRRFKEYRTSERLVYRREFVVRVVKRAVYEDPVTGTVAAPSPPVPSCLSLDTDRCHYDASVVVHVVAEKLVWHMPFYRQEARMAALGVGYRRSTMCLHFGRISSALEDLYRRMCAIILQCDVLHADETHVDMLDPGGGGRRTCWIWVRRSGVGAPLTAFHFSLHRDSETAKKLLGDYAGTIVRDAYAAYGCLDAEAAGCWAHVRRHFFRAQEALPAEAARALALIRSMYAIERRAKEEAEARAGETALFKARRRFRKDSAKLVDDFFALCGQIAGAQPPSDPAARAAGYALKQEKELRRFLDNPKLNIDNNPCENVIRPLCVGRKNWLFVGNEDGGASMAVLASFAATCKDNGVDFEEWLNDIVYRLDDTPSEKMDCLLPHLWKQARLRGTTADTQAPHAGRGGCDARDNMRPAIRNLRMAE